MSALAYRSIWTPTICVALTLLDAICDRLIHRAHRLTLKGPTMRERCARVSRGASSESGGDAPPPARAYHADDILEARQSLEERSVESIRGMSAQESMSSSEAD